MLMLTECLAKMFASVTNQYFCPQSDVGLIKTGDKVGASEATLLNMLNISPFSFGLIIQQVYDNGSVYSPEVLDITEASLHARFLEVRLSLCIKNCSCN